MKLPYTQLARRLDERIDPVYVLAGDQELLRELAERKLEHAVLGDDPSPFLRHRFDGEATSAERVVSAANTMPLLGGRLLVLVKRATALLEKEEALVRYLEDPSPHSVLVLDLDRKLDARRRISKDLEKLATVVACDAPRDEELLEWVAEEAASRGLRLGREESAYLVTELGSDLRRLANELEKLSLYASGERLDLETIAVVIGRGKAQSVFRFIDAVAAGEAGPALRQLGRLLEEGEAPLRILALVDRLVGQLRIARDARSSGRRDQSLASLLGAPPAAARVLSERARRLDDAFLNRAVVALAETDRLLKSSRLPQRVIMEGLVLSLTRRRTPRYAEATRRARRDL